jgi:hypothetical protein
MIKRNDAAMQAGMILLWLGAAACQSGGSQATPVARVGSPITLAPARMAPTDTVDERYQSYNVEMLEVTGGKFGKPYGPELDSILKVKQPIVVVISLSMAARWYSARQSV